MITTTTNRKTLVIVAHPQLHTNSTANIALMKKAEEHATTVRDLYAIYSNNQQIDVSKEQALLLEHDRIIFQFPIWWYSCPSLLKRWFDEVLTYGFAYGEGGNKLHQKEWGLAVTAGGSDFAYSAQGYNLFPLEQLLRPFAVTAHTIGASFLPVFSIYNVMKMTEEELELKTEEYAIYLTSSMNPVRTAAI
ncbi:NAD(P)H-dependent oxidoreductase [Paenibacillus yanchengensis]|uniref:NAD(P)H-dependent oxidoreductase n=1 Tax=Paenibacillus yanchengensis TaxID=2035833 RepID=A0ABW4YPH8_9BACL